MKKIIYNYPKSSFLSTEKDTSIIVNMMMKNDRLKKMLYYTKSGLYIFAVIPYNI